MYLMWIAVDIADYWLDNEVVVAGIGADIDLGDVMK